MTAEQAAPRGRRETAWLGLFANVLVFPGLGTLFLGRRILGAAQLLFALLGCSLLLSESVFTEAFALGLLVGAVVWSVATALGAFGSTRCEA